MKIVIALIAILIIAGLAGGCTINYREDKMETKNYDITGFTRIEAGGAIKINIERAANFQVTVAADDIDHITVEKSGDTLFIKRQGIEWFTPFHHRPVATIYLPVLTGLNIYGASEGNVNNFDTGADLEITASGATHVRVGNVTAGKVTLKIYGASSLTGDIKAQHEVKFEASGASKIELSGAATDARLSVYGASKAELGNYPLQNASLEISGASNAIVNLNGKLDANVSGASHLYWSGTPLMGNISTSGASTIGAR
jgi:hypothetical protein